MPLIDDEWRKTHGMVLPDPAKEPKKWERFCRWSQKQTGKLIKGVEDAHRRVRNGKSGPFGKLSVCPS